MGTVALPPSLCACVSVLCASNITYLFTFIKFANLVFHPGNFVISVKTFSVKDLEFVRCRVVGSIFLTLNILDGDL